MAILNRTVVGTQSKTTTSVRLGSVLLAAGAIIVVLGVLRIVQTSCAATASFKIQGLEQQKLELETSVWQLEADVAGLSSLARIEEEAKRLGLAAPEAQESVEVNVPWSGADGGLPSRFAPRAEEPEVVEQDAPWWRDLLKLLPFY